MPFQRPTLAQLIDRAARDIEARLPGVQPGLPVGIAPILARQIAEAVHGLYGNIDFLARQVVPDTKEDEYLDRWASLFLSEPRKAATSASGDVTFTGANGSVIPAGTELQRADAAIFTTDAQATIADGTATVTVTAQAAGSAGNTSENVALSLFSPIPGVNESATVAAGGITGGVESESNDSVHARLLSRLREPPHGGTSFDYVAWALEVPGVTRAWCYPLEDGDGTVTVRFMTDDLTADGIPSAGMVDDVAAYIAARRPVGAIVTVAAPVAVPLDFTITTVPDTAGVRDAIEASLRDLIRRDTEPAGFLYLSRIREAISLAAGEFNHVLTEPADDVETELGEITTFGEITWA